MAAEKKYLAFDLGAESGRGVIGFYDGKRLRLEDAHRFANGPTRILDALHWDALRLFSELKTALGRAVAAHGKDWAGIGIDSWGADFGLLGRDDELIGNPRHYRDRAFDGSIEAACARVPRETIYGQTGIQFLQFNTLLQLDALKRRDSPALEAAKTLLFIPDLLNFWFTGVKATEFSIASTGQMLDPNTRTWANDLIKQFGLPTDILTEILEPGATIGPLRGDIAAETGCGPVSIFAPAEHDTGSAIVAAPSSSPDTAYISSGTWSLIGVELDSPRVSDATREANFTNEGGVCGTTRLLKNVMGLWLVQECRRTWARQGASYSYEDLTALATAAPPFRSLMNPDAPAFFAPADMPDAIRRFCAAAGEPEPEDAGATVRCCLESLALKYRWAIEKLEAFRGAKIHAIHIVGGGTQNRLLCQLTADATRRPVIAGPVEATAIGNILMQMMANGEIASLAQARVIVRRSFDLTTYTPTPDGEVWEAAYARLRALLSPALRSEGKSGA